MQSALYPLAQRFVAGDDAASAIAAVRRLNDAGMSATLDMLGEDVGDAVHARRVRDGYLDLIERVAASGVRTNLSLKASALGLTFDAVEAQANFAAILDRAQVLLADPFVRIDMEGYELVASTLAFFETAWSSRKNTGPVLQAYLHRTPGDVARAIGLGARVRLCKGAYAVTDAIAVRDRHAIQSQFLACAVRLLRDGVYPAIATHDADLVAGVRHAAAALGRGPEAFEFQLLYGVNTALQRELVSAGCQVRIYVPFGTRWARYLRRRMFERRENMIFALRSFLGRHR